jgi:outer membrane protein W
MRSRVVKLASAIGTMGLILVSSFVSARAQSLDERHQLELKLLGWTQVTDVRTETRPGGYTTSVDAGGVGTGLTYGHWFEERWAWGISVGAMAADVEVRSGSGGTETETAVVTHILLGVKHYFLRSTDGSSVRPFVGGRVGPYIGNQTRTETGPATTVESRMETTLGGQIGGGIDFLTGRHFMAGISVDYNLMADFDKPIGGSNNYGGPVFGIGFSYLFGKGAE